MYNTIIMAKVGFIQSTYPWLPWILSIGRNKFNKSNIRVCFFITCELKIGDKNNTKKRSALTKSMIKINIRVFVSLPCLGSQQLCCL